MSKEEDEKIAEAMMDPGLGVIMDNTKLQPSSVPDKKQEKEETKETVSESISDYKESKDLKGKPLWYTEPTFEDQFKRFPDTARMVGPIVSIFNVTEPSELASLNALMAKQQPDGAPTVIIASKKENFYEGKWLMLLEYFRVEYKQLISTT